jgi:hypothetical protein
MQFGERVAGEVAPSVLDAWTFAGEVGQVISIAAESTDGVLDTDLSLLAPDGSVLLSYNVGGVTYDSATRGSRIASYRLTRSGTYTILVGGYGGSSGAYSLSLTLEEFLPPTATPLPARRAHVGTIRGEIPVGGGEVWTYLGQAGEVLAIRAGADHPVNEQQQQIGLLDTFVIVRAPDGSQLAEADDIAVSVLTDSAIEGLTLPEDGEYEIEVRSYKDLTGGPYTLTIELSEQPNGVGDSSLMMTATPSVTPSVTLTP